MRFDRQERSLGWADVSCAAVACGTVDIDDFDMSALDRLIAGVWDDDEDKLRPLTDFN